MNPHPIASGPLTDPSQKKRSWGRRLLLGFSILLAGLWLLRGGRERPAPAPEAVPAAQSPVADQARRSDAAGRIAARPFQVGYQRIVLPFDDAAGAAQKRQLDIWYPTEEKEKPYNYHGQEGFAAKDAAVAPGRHPLILFSHGFLGAGDQSIFLTEACARVGYIVAAMNHADSLGTRSLKRRPAPNFADFAKWDDTKYRDRRDDLAALLNQFLKWHATPDSPWEGHVDEERIGGLGHSLGGYTLLGMAGGWPAWKDDRLKTVVLLSPYSQPYSVNSDLKEVTVPVMLQGGTLDFGITPFLPAIYDKLDVPKVLLVLKNETHFGWTNLVSLKKTTKAAAAEGNPELMVNYTIAFFDEHLLGSEPQKLLREKNSRLKSIQFQDQTDESAAREK